MLAGTNSRHASVYNKRAVFEIIRLGEDITRAEIAAATGLTSATITYVVRDLIAQGLVRETGPKHAENARAGIGLDIVAEAGFSVGLHMGRDVVTGVLIDLKGEVHDRVLHSAPLPEPRKAMARLVEAYERFAAHPSVDAERILGVGLVTAGPLDVRAGRITGGPQMPGWEQERLPHDMAIAVQRPVHFDNSGTAAAIGERWFGAGRRFPDFLLVTIGQGVGGGLILDGRVHRGRGLNAGELGHMVVDPNGHRCPCGARGCLETRFSLSALRRDLGPGFVSYEQLERRIAARDPALMAWFEDVSPFLAQAIGAVDNLLDLDAVILGGHIGRFPPEVLEFIRTDVERSLPRFRMAGRPHAACLEVSSVRDSAEALGAATLPIDHAFFPDPALGLISRGAHDSGNRHEEGVFTAKA